MIEYPDVSPNGPTGGAINVRSVTDNVSLPVSPGGHLEQRPIVHALWRRPRAPCLIFLAFATVVTVLAGTASSPPRTSGHVFLSRVTSGALNGKVNYAGNITSDYFRVLYSIKLFV